MFHNTVIKIFRSCFQHGGISILQLDHIPEDEFQLFGIDHIPTMLHSDCLEKDAVGFLLCMAVCVNSSGNLVLELQGLPFLTKFLKPVHHTDNILTVLLTCSFAADMFDSVTASSLVPFFLTKSSRHH